MEDAGDLLEGLDDAQREAVTTEAAPLAILAGAGAGKTRVLTRRIAWRARTGRLEARHALAVTFTRKAAGELQQRLEALGAPGATAGTIHAVALASLRRRAAEQGRAAPALLERKARVLVRLVGGRGATAALAARDIAGEIEWAKARLVAPDGYEAAVARAGRTPPRPAAQIADIYLRYEREKRRRRLADFDDLIWWCADALESDAEFAAAQRWRFRHLFVDEFQDVSPAQLRLLRGWLADRDDLCVVGDPDQAIYAFAGAEAAHLSAFPRHFRGGQVVTLGCNYRSTPEVLATAEALLADGGRRRPPRRATRAAGPAPTVTAYDTDETEANAIASGLRTSQASGVAWSRLAVLYRTNAQSAAFEEALTRARIPFRVRGDGRFLERPEVRAAIDALHESVRHAPGRSFAEHVGDLERDGDEASAERREHVDALARLAREYLALEDQRGDLDGFLAYLVTALRGESPSAGGDAVELLTFHRAKGLEFDTVFVAGLERGLVPISHADTPHDRDEERRLLYVALTRAERSLHLSYARERTLGGRSVRRARSPWLAPIEAALAPGGPAGDGTPRARPGIADARAALARAVAPGSTEGRPADPELLGALVEWRRALARASGVPAFVIFHDTTLRAVAAVKPTDRDALLAVPGIGPVKAERHGPAVLELVRQHAS